MCRVSLPPSNASSKHSQEAEVAQEEQDLVRAPSASAGSEKSAPSVSQKDFAQGRRRRKRSYAGETPCSLSLMICAQCCQAQSDLGWIGSARSDPLIVYI